MRSIASEVGISFGAVQTILTDILGMSNVSARWVPRMLTDDQKQCRLDISKHLLSQYEYDPGGFIERTWVPHFDPESKIQSMRWKHPGSTLPRSLRELFPQGR